MRWKQLVAATEIRLPFPIELSVRETVLGEELMLCMHVQCRETRVPTRIYFAEVLPAHGLVSAPAKYLRGILLRALEHELDESLYVDGEQLTDPHAGERSIG